MQRREVECFGTGKGPEAMFSCAKHKTDKRYCGGERTERLKIAESIRHGVSHIFKAARGGQDVSR